MVEKLIDGGAKAIDDARLNKIKSAYLVTCPKLKALEEFAKDFLLALYCDNKNSCLTCPGCKKVLSESMTDVYKIKPENGMIKIDMIRQISDFLYEKPFEAEYKTIVIYDGDKMNKSSQNALLKPLEQPPKNTCFLILSQSDFGILPTVISRCENIRLMKKSEEEIIQAFLNEGVSVKRANLLLNLSSGYLEEAKSLNLNEDYFILRIKVIESLIRLFKQNNYAISYFVELFEENKENCNEILDIIKLLIMDIIKFKLTGDKSVVVNVDEIDEIKVKSVSFTIGSLYNMMEKLLEFEEKMRFNINFKLTCESMFFEILKEKYKWLKS